MLIDVVQDLPAVQRAAETRWESEGGAVATPVKHVSDSYEDDDDEPDS